MTFRDIKSAIRTFSGKDATYAIETWVLEFENISDLLQLRNLQKALYAKRMLTDLVQLYVRSEKGLNTWDALRDVLLCEFVSKITSIELHKTFSLRKMRKHKNLHHHFLVMKELAWRGQTDEESVIKYVMDGISDDIGIKTALYGAKTFQDYKEKM